MVYNIWMEGYRCNGDEGRASFVGVAEGKNFKEACKNYVKHDKEFGKLFNDEKLTYWGCKLFDNESQARYSFG